MNNYLFFIFIVLIITIITLTVAITIITYKFKKKHYKLFKFLRNYLNAITSARYGNLNVKIENGSDSFTKKLSQDTNALFESIVDRDKMIQEYIEKEKERHNIKQDFMTTLTHDLKVPIIAQDNTYDLFLNKNFGELTKEQTVAIENLKISNNDLKKLILNLLDVQKIENNSLILNKEETELNSLIREIIKQDKSIFTIQKKEIIFLSNKDIINYNLDGFLFKRVLNNLISNAISHNKNSDKITVELIKTKENILINVIDEGSGIKEEDLNSIFQKYYTSSKKYSPTSTGLGLYIANKIISAHNGILSAKNNEIKGATFTITLPL